MARAGNNNEVLSPFSKSRIDYRILLLILVGIVSFQVFLGFLEDDDVENSIIIVSLSSQIATGTAALWIARKYWGSRIFGYSYLSLSVAFFSVAIGEILYNVYWFVFEIDPYPSFADVFFFLLYPFSLIHLVINLRFFVKINTTSIVWIIGFTTLATLAYIFVTYDILEEFSFDLSYGAVFVAGSSLITALGIYGAFVVRKIPLGRAWLLLVIGIILGTIADVWYHYLEILEAYDTSHIVNLFWYASYLVIIYALYKHQKII